VRHTGRSRFGADHTRTGNEVHWHGTVVATDAPTPLVAGPLSLGARAAAQYRWHSSAPDIAALAAGECVLLPRYVRCVTHYCDRSAPWRVHRR
jgi:hypothetical protein